MDPYCKTLTGLFIWLLLSVGLLILTAEVIQPRLKTECYNCPMGYRYCGTREIYTPPIPYCCNNHDVCEYNPLNCQSDYKYVYSCPTMWIILLEGALSLSIIASFISCCCFCFNNPGANYQAPRSERNNYDSYQKQSNQRLNLVHQPGTSNYTYQYS